MCSFKTPSSDIGPHNAPLSPGTAAFLSQTGHKHCSVRCRKDLCHSLSPPLSQAPPPLLSSGACHHPSPVSPHSVTDHSLYSAQNASPPLVRSTDVSARPYAHPLPSRSKSGPLFWLAHTASPGTQFTKHTQSHTHADTHKAYSPLERRAKVVTVITDLNFFNPTPLGLQHPSLMEKKKGIFKLKLR